MMKKTMTDAFILKDDVDEYADKRSKEYSAYTVFPLTARVYAGIDRKARKRDNISLSWAVIAVGNE